MSPIITSPPKVMGGYVIACVGRYIDAISTPIVNNRRQSYPWPPDTRWLNFGRSRSKVKVGWIGMRST